MRQTQEQREQSAHRLVLTGLVLEATAVALGVAGMVVWTIGVTSRTRQRIARMESTPSELARQHWAKAMAATSAGIGAWRGMSPVDRVHPARETSRS